MAEKNTLYGIGDISAAETMAEAGVIQSFSWITVSSEWIRRR